MNNIKQTYHKSIIQRQILDQIQQQSMSKELNQIYNMSQKIQEKIKIVFAQNNKTNFLSPQTNHHSNYNSSIPNKSKGNQTHERYSSEHKPIQNNHSHIRQFMVEQQNQILKEQIRELKDKNKAYRNQIKELKKYVEFMQKYNDDLKKQVVLWMTRPAKKEGYRQFGNLDDRFKQYRMKLAETINNKYSYEFNKNVNNYANYSTKQNSINLQPDNYHHNDEEDEETQTQHNINGYSQNLSKLNNIEVGYKNLSKRSQSQTQNIKRMKKTVDLNYSNMHDNPENGYHKQCTSCNYLEYVGAKKGFMKPMGMSKKQSKSKSKSSHKNSLKIQKRSIKPFMNASFDLKSFRNTDNLCPCHEQYMKNHRKF